MDSISALKIDSKYIYYKCKFCFRLNNKLSNGVQNNNSKKYIKLHNGYHIYNSNNNFDDRIITLKNHCLFSQDEFIKLSINNTTLKIKN